MQQFLFDYSKEIILKATLIGLLFLNLGNLSQEDKILLSRLLLLLNPSYQTQPLQHKDIIQSNIR